MVLKLITVLTLTAISILQASPVNAAQLKPPFFTPINPPSSKGKMESCPLSPLPPPDINIFKSIYEENDSTASTIDPKAKAAYSKAVAPLQHFENEINRRANSYVRTGGKDYSSAACALQWMTDWANAAAMTGTAKGQGQAVRKWALASFSSAYLQFGADRRLDSKQKVAVKKWLYRLAKQVMTDYSTNPDTSSRRNNHVYWAAWAVGITSVVIQHDDFFEWAMDKAKVGLIQIESDGTLPLEVRRAKRAQLYHLFATIPLVMLAELGRANGVDLYGYNDGALHRLVKLDVMQIYHPDYIEHRAGVKQDLPEENMELLLSWLEAYNRRFEFSNPDLRQDVAKLRKTYSPFFNRRIGGSATLLYGTPYGDTGAAKKIN